MNESVSTESNNITYNFLPRRYAQIYCDKWVKSVSEAEDWIEGVISTKDRPKMKELILAELERRGIKAT